MNSLWYLYDSKISVDVCKDILSYWNDIEAQKGKVGNHDYKLDTSVRSSKINKFPYSSPQQQIFTEILEPYITVANRECFGFDLNGLKQDGHYGVHTMRERAESVGGDLVIITEPGQGTRVTVKLPLK